MKAIYDPLKPHKEFALPDDFEGFFPERIKRIREIRKNQTILVDICLVRDSEQLKDVLKARLKKMGFMTKYNSGNKKGHEHLMYSSLAIRTGIRSHQLNAYFNHNRLIWNEAKGRYMFCISEANLLILCLFAGVVLSLDIEVEPLKLIAK